MQVERDDAMTSDLKSIKQALAKETYPHTLSSTALTVATSGSATRGVLEHHINGQWRPLVFFRWWLRSPKDKYSAFDRELLAVYLGVCHLRLLVYNVHRPETAHLHYEQAIRALACTLTTTVTAISTYTTGIQHTAAKCNQVTNSLSHSSTSLLTYLASVIGDLNYEAMAAAQHTENEMRAYFTAITSFSLQDAHFGSNDTTLLYDIFTGKLRQSSHKRGTEDLSMSFTDFPTQLLELQDACYQVNLSGMVW